jgi:hypothetical protein
MSLAETQYPNHVDPGVVPTREPQEPETIAVAEQDQERHTGDEDPFEKTYVAIDGIEAGDISDADSERLERAVVEFMLNNGYDISGARVISKEKNVVEFEREE